MKGTFTISPLHFFIYHSSALFCWYAEKASEEILGRVLRGVATSGKGME